MAMTQNNNRQHRKNVIRLCSTIYNFVMSPLLGFFIWNICREMPKLYTDDSFDIGKKYFMQCF